MRARNVPDVCAHRCSPPFFQVYRKPVYKVSFNGLLNALDGIVAQEGRIVFMTTNHRCARQAAGRGLAAFQPAAAWSHPAPFSSALPPCPSSASAWTLL